MRLKNLIWEDTVNYKKPSLFLGTAFCTFKCGDKLCQNRALADAPTVTVDDEDVIRRYQANPLTSAIVLGGMEPLDQLDDVCSFCDALNRLGVTDDLVIYTGYTEQEAEPDVKELREKNAMRNLIMKYGRYLPGRPSRFDPVLGVILASDNQYAVLYHGKERNA